MGDGGYISEFFTVYNSPPQMTYSSNSSVWPVRAPEFVTKLRNSTASDRGYLTPNAQSTLLYVISRVIPLTQISAKCHSLNNVMLSSHIYVPGDGKHFLRESVYTLVQSSYCCKPFAYLWRMKATGFKLLSLVLFPPSQIKPNPLIF